MKVRISVAGGLSESKMLLQILLGRHCRVYSDPPSVGSLLVPLIGSSCRQEPHEEGPRALVADGGVSISGVPFFRGLFY